MPYQIDAGTDGMLMIRCRGDLDNRTTGPVLRILESLFSPGPGYALWIHERGCRYVGSHEDALRVRLCFAMALEARGEGAIACVCPDIPTFGLCRLTQSLAGRSRVGIEIFREFASAEAWILEYRELIATMAIEGQSPGPAASRPPLWSGDRVI
jgi:hypothetical protein